MFAYCNNNPANLTDSSGNWPFWTNIIMVAYRLVQRVIADSNYAHNSVVDANSETTTNNKLVSDQNGATGNNFRFGNYDASYNACETIAVHNAKVLLGKESTLSQTMYD